MAIPKKDARLVDWSTNVDARLTASPATYGTTPAIALAYRAVHEPFITAYANLIAARAAGVRSEAMTAIKQSTKQALLDYARSLYRTIQANIAVSSAAKIELGIHLIDSAPTPIPVPGDAPALRVNSVNGRTVSITLSDAARPDRKGLPPGVNGAIVLSHVGPTPPTDPALYLMQGPTSRATMEINFPEILVPGTQVWLIAVWFNARKRMGPACQPVGAQINFGGSMPMAA